MQKTLHRICQSFIGCVHTCPKRVTTTTFRQLLYVKDSPHGRYFIACKIGMPSPTLINLAILLSFIELQDIYLGMILNLCREVRVLLQLSKPPSYSNVLLGG